MQPAAASSPAAAAARRRRLLRRLRRPAHRQFLDVNRSPRRLDRLSQRANCDPPLSEPHRIRAGGIRHCEIEGAQRQLDGRGRAGRERRRAREAAERLEREAVGALRVLCVLCVLGAAASVLEREC